MAPTIGITDGSGGIKRNRVGIAFFNQIKWEIVWLENGIVAGDLSWKSVVIVPSHHCVAEVDGHGSRRKPMVRIPINIHRIRADWKHE